MSLFKDCEKIAIRPLYLDRLYKNNVSIHAASQSFILTDSDNVPKVQVGSGSLGTNLSTAANLMLNSGFELDGDGDKTPEHWYLVSSSVSGSGALGDDHELWNSGSISLSVTASSAGEGSRVFRISVGEELGSNIGLNQNESD